MHATITPQFALPPACPGLLSPHLLLHWGCPLVLCNPPRPHPRAPEGSFRIPCPQQRTDLRGVPWPQARASPLTGPQASPPRCRACTYAFSPPYPGAATLPTARLPPATSPTGWHPPGSGSHRCLTTPCSPLLLAKGPIPIDWPWGGRKDPPATPTPPVLLRLPAVTAEGGLV